MARTASGAEIEARCAVLAATAASNLYGELVSWDHLPARLRDDMRRFQWDYSTFKVDWALRQPVPWLAPEVAGAGTVHVAASLDETTEYSAQLSTGRVPARPFVLAGQMTTADPQRSPPGTESLWAYNACAAEGAGRRWRRPHWLVGRERARGVRRPDRGAGRTVRPGMARPDYRRRVTTTPGQFEASDANLVGGALNGGTTAVHQQLVFRPTPGLGRPETPIADLYLASSSAQPGVGYTAHAAPTQRGQPCGPGAPIYSVPRRPAPGWLSGAEPTRRS